MIAKMELSIKFILNYVDSILNIFITVKVGEEDV